MKENKFINDAISQLRSSLGSSLKLPIKLHALKKTLAELVIDTKKNNPLPIERIISFKVAGVTYENRQSVIAILTTHSRIYLQRDVDNPFDVLAIQVVTNIGQSIGFVPKDVAKNIAPLLDSGLEAIVNIEKISGGGPRYSYGVMVRGVIK